ncbi:hypothetical protein CHC07_00466 [Variovorax sp. B4]|nr:hypothetical protein CHC07_00466 [Variovorax sp. B4]
MSEERMLAVPVVAAFLSYGATGGPTIGAASVLSYPAMRRGRGRDRRSSSMLKYAIIFAIVSLIAGALGFGGIAAGAAGIAKLLFGLFLILAVLFLVLAALGIGAAKKALD